MPAVVTAAVLADGLVERPLFLVPSSTALWIPLRDRLGLVCLGFRDFVSIFQGRLVSLSMRETARDILPLSVAILWVSNF